MAGFHSPFFFRISLPAPLLLLRETLLIPFFLTPWAFHSLLLKTGLYGPLEPKQGPRLSKKEELPLRSIELFNISGNKSLF